MFIVEIKNSGDMGYEACRILSETLDQYPEYRDRIVVGTFHDEIEVELKSKYPDLMRGAPTGTQGWCRFSDFSWDKDSHNMEETIMPMAQLKVAMMMEQEGFMALPQRRHQQIMAEGAFAVDLL